MTPAILAEALRSGLAAMADGRCLCRVPGFRKVVSFDFRSYGIAPTALADSECLIDAVLRDRSRYRHEVDGEHARFVCLICAAVLDEHYEEFSISMSATVIPWPHPEAMDGCYAVGFYGLEPAVTARISDFRRVGLADFMARVGIAG